MPPAETTPPVALVLEVGVTLQVPLASPQHDPLEVVVVVDDDSFVGWSSLVDDAWRKPVGCEGGQSSYYYC